jgi:hypothetical protein
MNRGEKAKKDYGIYGNSVHFKTDKSALMGKRYSGRQAMSTPERYGKSSHPAIYPIRPD